MTRIQWRRDTAAAWTAANPILYEGEAGLETNTLKVKVGDGVTAWNSLGYLTAPGAELLANKGQANGYASLDSNGKVPGSQLPNSIMTYEGLHDVSANSPTLSDATGDAGSVYRVSVAGTRNYGSGNITLNVGDYLIHSGSVWQLADTTDAVSSVAGRSGNVTLTSADVGLGNVDNTSDATKLSANGTLTNKVISGASNTISDIPQNAVTGLSAALDAKVSRSVTETAISASGSLELTTTSTRVQVFTGSGEFFTVTVPNFTTTSQDCGFVFYNRSADIITVQTTFGGDVGYLPPAHMGEFFWNRGTALLGSGWTARMQPMSGPDTLAFVDGDLGTPSSVTLSNATGLPVAGISATGTRNSTTYLRGDGSWQSVSGGISTGKAIAMAMVFG